MAQIFHKTFATDLSEFSSVSVSNGTLEWSAGAGLNGTTGGVLATRTANSPSCYGNATDMPLNGLVAARWAFWLDLSDLTVGADGGTTIIWYPRDSSGNARLGSMRMAQVSGVPQLQCQVLPDTDVTVDEFVPLTSLPNWVEVEVIREVTNGSNDGEMRFYFGGGDYPDTGTQVAEFLTVQNYVDFNAVDRTRLGMQFGSALTSGTLKVDELIVVNDNTPILFGVSESVISRGMKYVLNRRRRKSYCW